MIHLPRLIGVIHLPALVGAPGSYGQLPVETLHAAGMLAVKEAQVLEQAGFQGIILENFGDIPFYKDHVPPETIACLSVIAAAVREAVSIPIGLNFLRNDGSAALAVAAVTGCDWIRVNVLSGVTASDQGFLEGNAAHLLREKGRLQAPVAIFADVHVKHGKTLSSDDIALAVEEAGLRALADAVIVSGTTTGRLVDLEILKNASRRARELQIPLYLGSGVTRESLPQVRLLADGVIVSSTLRKGGKAGAPLDLKRTKEFAREFLKPKTKLKIKPKTKPKTPLKSTPSRTQRTVRKSS